MGLELNLLNRFLNNRDEEAAYYGYIKNIENIDKDLKILYTLVHKYYEETDDKKINPNDIKAFYDIKHPNNRSRPIHMDLVDKAYAAEVKDHVIRQQVDQLIEKHHATQIINKLLPAMEGDKYGILDTVVDDVNRYIELLHNPPAGTIKPEPYEIDIVELARQEVEEPGLAWHLPTLTDTIGGLRRKLNGLIYAYVDAGKTSFAMSAMAKFAEQLMDTDECILYCGNEEPAYRMSHRITQAFTNWTRNRWIENPEEARDLAKEKGLDVIKLFDGIKTGEQIEYLLRTYNPYALFIDQAHKVEIKTRRKLEGVAYLETLFQWYRDISNSHDVALIGVTQGDAKAESTKYLKLSDIYGSRVGIQASLDWAVGIGMSGKNGEEHKRFFRVSKNKLHSGEKTQFIATFDHYRCQWGE